jgi:hypothetical protein
VRNLTIFSHTSSRSTDNKQLIAVEMRAGGAYAHSTLALEQLS